MKVKHLVFILLILLTSSSAFTQGSPDYKGGLKIKLNEDSSKYIRFITWGQAQLNFDLDAPSQSSTSSFNLRRARLLAFSQFNKKFLILTHFGVNSLRATTLSPTGTGSGSQIFMHDMYIQYAIHDKHAVGAGLHYFNGVSRLNNQSTLNMLTLDNNRASWATLGLTDQFARHIGLFLKGSFGQLQYQLAVNEVSLRSIDNRTDPFRGNTYQGRMILGSKDAGKAYAGYFSYNFWEKESNFLPFKVGSYLGSKKILNIGAGFFYHPNGNVSFNTTNAPVGNDVTLFAIDVFYDNPIGNNGSSITFYAVSQFNDYGEDYLFGPYGSGKMIYSHIGYLLPGDKTKTRWQPYLSYMNNSFDVDETRSRYGIGANMYLSGHNAKVTAEYNSTSFADDDNGVITIQAMIYI